MNAKNASYQVNKMLNTKSNENQPRYNLRTKRFSPLTCSGLSTFKYPEATGLEFNISPDISKVTIMAFIYQLHSNRPYIIIAIVQRML